MTEPLRQIMLVDDDDVTNFINEELVKDSGLAHEVVTRSNGLEALDYIASLQEAGNADPDKDFVPELILLDINMPEMNGFEFLEKLHQYTQKHYKPVVVIMLTTSLIDDDMTRARKHRELVAEYMEKPLNKEKLQHIIQRFFDSRQQKDGAEQS